MARKKFFERLRDNAIQITKSDLELDKYKTADEEGDDTSNEKGKGKNEYNGFDHLEKHEVVGVINHVLRDLMSNDIKDAYRIENLIRNNYEEWSGKRAEAIEWLKNEMEETIAFNQGFESVK